MVGEGIHRPKLSMLKPPAAIWKQLVVDGSCVLDISDKAYYNSFCWEELQKSSQPPNPKWSLESIVYVFIHNDH